MNLNKKYIVNINGTLNTEKYSEEDVLKMMDVFEEHLTELLKDFLSDELFESVDVIVKEA